MKTLNKETFQARTKSDENGCWIWQGALKNRSGGGHKYGWVAFNKTQMTAHRLSWLLFNGDLPAGVFVCHKCDVPACVNPSHLFLGSHADNMRDMWNKGRHAVPIRNLFAAKVSLSELALIRGLLAQGESQSSIGKRFGLTQSAISRISTGRNWSKHV